MSKKQKLVLENLEELSKRIDLLVNQYNSLAESEDIYGQRLIVVSGTSTDFQVIEHLKSPINIYDLTSKYTEDSGWSNSSSCEF